MMLEQQFIAFVSDEAGLDCKFLPTARQSGAAHHGSTLKLGDAVVKFGFF